MGFLSSYKPSTGVSAQISQGQRTAFYGLVCCLVIYVLFHLIRPAIPPELSLLRDSFPSLLLGAAMTISVGLIPAIQFKNFLKRSLYTLAAVLLGAIWFEAIVPTLLDQTNFRPTGSINDFLAMPLGSLLVLVFMGLKGGYSKSKIKQSFDDSEAR